LSNNGTTALHPNDSFYNILDMIYDDQREEHSHHVFKNRFNREYKHANNVSHYCEQIAIRMYTNNNPLIFKVRIAGFLHDIGKSKIDEKILNTPGSLSEEEWFEIKKHPEIGAKMMGFSNRYENVLDIKMAIYQHHERLNGSGYPLGIKGDQIILPARIIAVADSFDAMTNKRVYQKEYSVHDALYEIKKQAGILYDPAVVDCFCDYIRSP